LKAVEKWGVGDKGVRENNWSVWTNQSKVHPQCAYIVISFKDQLKYYQKTAHKLGTVCVGGTSGKGKGEGRILRWWYMADWLHIPIWNRTKKPLAIALSGVGLKWGWEGVEW
jgi:hypothetical protein